MSEPAGCETIECPDDREDMYFPHPTRCDAFCQCSNGVPYQQDCPAGLHYNRVLHVCDWPENANCPY